MKGQMARKTKRDGETVVIEVRVWGMGEGYLGYF